MTSPPARHRLNPFLRVEQWFDAETDQSYKEAVIDWLLNTLCDPDAPIPPSEVIQTRFGEATATEVRQLDLVVIWRFQPMQNRMDVIDLEPIPYPQES